MEALTSSSMKIFTNTTLTSSKALLSKSEIHFFPSQKTLVNFSYSVSLNHKAVRFLASSSDTMVLMGLETAETGIQAIQPSKTVRVKFQLQRECLFGEYFLLVGDDPIIGLWNPSSAIPLGWSEGHMWTIELDIPIEKSIQFKFILKQSTEDILWQPGPDRIFRTWETKNTIIIAEDWEDAEVQKITEECVGNQNEELMTNPDMEPVDAWNVSHSREELMPNVNEDMMFSDNIVYPKDESMVNRSKEFIAAEYTTCPEDEPLINENKELYSADNAGFEKEELMNKNISRTLTDKNPVSAEDKKTLLTYEEGPVLVPGLTPLQAKSTEEALSKESVKSIDANANASASVGVDAAKDHNMPEVTF